MLHAERSNVPHPTARDHGVRQRTSLRSTCLLRPETLELFSQRQPPAGSSRALGWDTPSAPSSSGTRFHTNSIGHLGYSGCSLWLDREAQVSIILLSNRTWPDRGNDAIRSLRPAFHDAVRKGLGI